MDADGRAASVSERRVEAPLYLESSNLSVYVRRVTLRRAAIIVCILDTAAACLLAGALLFSASDPATSGLDMLAGLAILGLLALTVLPAAILLWRGKSAKLAFALSLALPILVVALVIAAAIAIA